MAAIDLEYVSDEDPDYEEEDDEEDDTDGEGSIVYVDDDEDDGAYSEHEAETGRRRGEETEDGSALVTKRNETGESSQASVSHGEVEQQRASLSCPICFEPWSSEGPHRFCCIPCGHVYGRSCLERWAHRFPGSNGKCPQCNRRFRKRDIINLFAPLIGVRDDDLEKELRILREKSESLALEKAQLVKELGNEKKRALEVKPACIVPKRHLNYAEGWNDPLHSISAHRDALQNRNTDELHHCSFNLKEELMLDGARTLGIDAYSQILIVSVKPSFGRDHLLKKISLFVPHVADTIQLPLSIGAIRDLCILPDRLVLLASLEKKLLLFSTESNNLLLNYDLPAPAWSCSYDVNNTHHFFAGLQNGLLCMFDLRQTFRPLASITGLSNHPVHTIHSIMDNNGGRRILTASSLGPCVWDVSGAGERPFLIPGMENHGVCISLAYNCLSNDIVASFRPKVDAGHDVLGSQTATPPSCASVSASGKWATHVLIKRDNGLHYRRSAKSYGFVSGARMSKSAIITVGNANPLFAYGDEYTHGACLLDLPSFDVCSHLKPHQKPILDIRYAHSTIGPGLLGCLSEEKMQIFTCSSNV